MKTKWMYMPLALALSAAAAGQTTPPPAPPAPPPASGTTTAKPAPPKPPKPPRPHMRHVNTNRAYLGARVDDITPDRVAALKLKNDHGVEVLYVDQDGPAAKAGLKEHDVILTYNGQNVGGTDDIRRLIRDTAPGRSVKLGVSRDGQPVTLTATLGRRTVSFPGMSTKAMKIDIPPIDVPPMEFDVPGFAVLPYSMRAGLMVEDLTPQLGEYFGVKNGHGVLVRSVERGSPAEAAGLRAGDVIVRVGKNPVPNTNEWRRLSREANGGALQVGIVRERREQTLSLKLPPRRSGIVDTAALHAQLQQVKPEIDAAMAEWREEFRKHMKDYEKAMEKMSQQLEEGSAETPPSTK